MAKRVAAVHTGIPIAKLVGDLWPEILPDVELINIVDDSIVPAAVQAGRVDENITTRMYQHFAAAQLSGADLILLTCSTVGETADVARQLIATPIVKIDEAMAEKAVAAGPRIGVLATVESTLGPTSRLIQRKAAEAGRQVEVKTRLVAGAWEILGKGDAQRHDQMVMDGIGNLAKEADVIVLAQASIARILPQLGPVGVPVLASPRSGAERVKQILKGK